MWRTRPKKVGVTQGSKPHVTAVSKHLVRGLRGMSNISTTALVKSVWIPFGCNLSYASAISAISATRGIISEKFRIYTIYNPHDGEFDISGSDMACCVCARPSRVLGGARVLTVLECWLIV